MLRPGDTGRRIAIAQSLVSFGGLGDRLQLHGEFIGNDNGIVDCPYVAREIELNGTERG